MASSEPGAAASAAAASDADVADDAELSARLLPFQRQGVALGIALGGRLLLGDEMGLGKTVQAIAIARHFRAEWPLLVVCPTSLALPWAEELERWCPSLLPGEINLVKSHHNGALRSAKVTILTYGLVTNGKEKQRLMRSVLDAGFRCAIADEAHYLKSKDSQRSQLLLPVLARAARCILLTGTPALSRPVELFTLVSTVAPHVAQWSTYTRFTERFCDAKLKIFGRGQRRWDVSGSSNSEELFDLLAEHVMVRRMKASVLSQLPPKRRLRVLVTLPKGADANELAALEKQSRALSPSDERGKQALLSAMLVTLGAAKGAAAAEYALELLRDAGKILFFAHHRSVLDEMERAAASQNVTTLRIDGSVPASERAALVARFQGLPDTQPAIFILSIQAAGQGLTLTAASTVVFAELRWVPGELLQAEDRAHRLGQSHSVNVHYLIAKDTPDEAMWAVLQRKVRTLGATLDGNSKTRLQVDGRQAWGATEEEEAGTNGSASQGDADGAGGGEASGSGEGAAGTSSAALSHLARKVERERLAKTERKCPPPPPPLSTL